MDCLFPPVTTSSFPYYYSYEFYEQPENGELNWIVPNKILAFPSPARTDIIAPSSEILAHSVQFFIPLFQSWHITGVVRLNNKLYDSVSFTTRSINHYDLYFDDGSIPTRDIVHRFITIVDNELSGGDAETGSSNFARSNMRPSTVGYLSQTTSANTNSTLSLAHSPSSSSSLHRPVTSSLSSPGRRSKKPQPLGGAVAVHCKAGLGRTGTLIACYLMYKYGFTAIEAIAWIRICRPGSIVGLQQHFLIDMEDELTSAHNALQSAPTDPQLRVPFSHPSSSSSSSSNASSQMPAIVDPRWRIQTRAATAVSRANRQTERSIPQLSAQRQSEREDKDVNNKTKSKPSRPATTAGARMQKSEQREKETPAQGTGMATSHPPPQHVSTSRSSPPSNSVPDVRPLSVSSLTPSTRHPPTAPPRTPTSPQPSPSDVPDDTQPSSTSAFFTRLLRAAVSYSISPSKPPSDLRSTPRPESSVSQSRPPRASFPSSSASSSYSDSSPPSVSPNGSEGANAPNAEVMPPQMLSKPASAMYPSTQRPHHPHHTRELPATNTRIDIPSNSLPSPLSPHHQLTPTSQTQIRTPSYLKQRTDTQPNSASPMAATSPFTSKNSSSHNPSYSSPLALRNSCHLSVEFEFDPSSHPVTAKETPQSNVHILVIPNSGFTPIPEYS